MSGHSKWATTKHKKAVIDSRRAKLFAKLIKNIEVAARLGGPDIDGNPTLYDAVQKGRKSSLPNDNIDRAIKRGAGIGGDAVEYTTIIYEGYGPNGVALLIECLTDNKNRAAAEVRLAVSRNGGTMADPGSVSYQFSRKGVIVVAAAEGVSEDSLLEAVLEVGVDDIEAREDQFVNIHDFRDRRRHDARQRLVRPMVEDLHDWMRAERARMSKHNPVAKAINYMFEEGGRWDAFTRFLKEGVLNPRVGRELRTKVLAKGNSEPIQKSERSEKKDKRKAAKQEVAKVVTPERASEINSVVAKIAASTIAAHEAAGEESLIPVVKHEDAEATSSAEATPSEQTSEVPAVAVLDAVLEALPEPTPPGQSRRKGRRVTTATITTGIESENTD